MRITVFLIIGLLPLQGMSAAPETFRQAKKAISRIYTSNPSSFYCNCPYKKINGKLRVDLNNCDYQIRKNARRAARIEWEHVVPAHHFGHTRQCWREKICSKKNGKKYKGRRCCTKTDPTFRKMASDLHNLVPAIGEVNGDRSNFKYGMIEGEKRAYGKCNIEIDFKSRITEPRPEVQGDIARIYFYMNKTYEMPISKKQRNLFDVWHKIDPVSDWEKIRNNHIKNIQGAGNPFIQ